ncbi:precorrin-4 C(11)-methyltransferase [Aureivirga sp. CE67]|uniref:precorrin-4 C(11)-methyltransferase n=1 Tax=Aureivirga sp. CE67 TaxID=1788983 RepID=UPI0018CA9B1B|nr:precorrin-4 C(11)-methyltransferase [Aureivirga sp. CE67]
MNENKKIAIICFTDSGTEIALKLQTEFHKSLVFTTRENYAQKNCFHFEKTSDVMADKFHKFTHWIFVGALGICVRSIADFIQDKTTDPAVINVDDQGKFAQSVLSGHLGGANKMTEQISRILQATPVISTSSDNQNKWSLDTISKEFNWTYQTNTSLNECISLFINNKKTALVLKVKDKGTEFLEKSTPKNISIFYDLQDLNPNEFELLLYVGYEKINSTIPFIAYYPKCLHLGSGCKKDIESDLFENALLENLEKNNIAPESIASLGSAFIKENEKAYLDICKKYNWNFSTFSAEELDSISTPNPSEKVIEKVGVPSVSESSASLLSNNQNWLLEKTKITVDSGKKFTLAISLDSKFERRASIAIIGAGSGDPDLLTIKGKELIEKADCVLYAGSLVPEKLTHFAKEGALVRNSASMTLEQQFEIMDSFYKAGKFIVRLHSGDPSIYGAIQEQMTLFDERGYDYFIVPGISSFQAAAAYLKSEFTIPEVTQSIILTRGEGNTPMPEHENLEEMAKHRATMCVFLSAGIVKKVQKQLMAHYPSETPLAVLYRVSWEDEQVWTGKLEELTSIIKDNKLTRTVLIVVGEAVGARKNRSWLYGDNWHHIFRKKTKITPSNN